MEFVFLDPQDILLFDMHFCLYKEKEMQTKYNYQRALYVANLGKVPKFSFKKSVIKRVLKIIWDAFINLFIGAKMVRQTEPGRWEEIPPPNVYTISIM
jgi:hypothetical protein